MPAPDDEPDQNLGPEPAQPEPPAGLDYSRRVYAMVIDWYKVAETKAQLLLTANGAFATVFFGLVATSLWRLPSLKPTMMGSETWFFLAVGVVALSGAVAFAAAGLLSRHQHNIKADFARLGIQRKRPGTYTHEAAWYFGHIASLKFGDAVDLLRTVDQQREFEVLTYNVVGLSHVVLRKHRLVNAGWFLTAVSIVAMIATTLSFFIRSQI
ncbi:hypothetical protein [Virgisporangium aurantiacum]|uniref:Pycsar effector protein domain-containing protein n=1 Tax=Virgisporangium aurantiacum TaxID=175570 RepID=A0A8J4E7T9_9ACTN|nr:hypothetical protein [Virgisporangium aurantiacum]GIJ64916.1 hypothetical protein Vau01_124320 [Virgisporangium aurantiacum]